MFFVNSRCAKVSFQMENAIWLFGGMVGSMCWSFTRVIVRSEFFKLHIWIRRALHFHCSRHYTGCRCIQLHRYDNNGWESRKIDKKLLWFGADLFGCQTVRTRIWTIMEQNSIAKQFSALIYTGVSRNSIKSSNIPCLHFFHGTCLLFPLYSWRCSFKWLSIHFDAYFSETSQTSSFEHALF